MTWTIPAPGIQCPNCGHDMSAHTGPCIMVEVLINALGNDERTAEATLDGVTMRVEQHVNPFTNELFWIWGDKSKREDESGCDVSYDRAWMEEDVFDAGFDPDALIWQRGD